MSSELIGPVSGTSEDDEAGSLRKGGSEIRRKARRNFRVADILNLQIRPARTASANRSPGAPISISRRLACAL